MSSVDSQSSKDQMANYGAAIQKKKKKNYNNNTFFEDHLNEMGVSENISY